VIDELPFRARRSSSTDSLCVGYKRFVGDRPPTERAALFHDNAARIYRITDAGAPGSRG
jgi:predicted TIM-barrel fold metal-dependent hydrolase